MGWGICPKPGVFTHQVFGNPLIFLARAMARSMLNAAASHQLWFRLEQSIQQSNQQRNSEVQFPETTTSAVLPQCHMQLEE